MFENLLFTIKKEKHNVTDLKEILNNHPEIKFVSLVGVDLAGNDTDEKIPIKLFIDDMDTFINGTAVQTDGSSVVLPEIATLNNAKVDMITDNESVWFIDYNYDFVDPIINKPIGTLRIPCYLYHNDIPVCSRNILSNAIKNISDNILTLFKEKNSLLNDYQFKYEDIESLQLTAATELEFWVKTPNDKAHVEELSFSQTLKEQYWQRTKGIVRTALEETLLLLDAYGFEPEMGHKEVGGINGKLDNSGNYNHVMEQLEIDWKYTDAAQAADNELFIRSIVKETFRRHGLYVNFLAKPISGVAGSGKHTHFGISAKLKNGKRVNLFASNEKGYLSTIGYASIMGLLKNYEIINPFVSATNDSLKRLKPGFEAPICVVTSLGESPEVPSRNRTILVGLIRDLNNPMATRFELRSPNPYSNTYLVLAACYQSMLDGILYAADNNKTEADLLAELSKQPGEDSQYLEKDRAYRTEKDVFEDFTDEEREHFFGTAPETVYENIKAFDIYNDKLNVLKLNDVFTDSILNSFKIATLTRWATELSGRMINNYIDEVRSCKCLHSSDKVLDLDVSNWLKINDLRNYLMKDTNTTNSLFTKIKRSIKENDFETASVLQKDLYKKMELLRDLYSDYKKNLLDF